MDMPLDIAVLRILVQARDSFRIVGNPSLGITSGLPVIREQTKARSDFMSFIFIGISAPTTCLPKNGIDLLQQDELPSEGHGDKLAFMRAFP
jgi:hypothetical protein